MSSPATGFDFDEARVCRICGCTDDDACIGHDGQPCHWVTGELCSRCLEPTGQIDLLRQAREYPD